jgi:DNA-binding NtrC family response regulator
MAMSYSVLIVDDDPAVRNSLAAFMEDSGFAVLSAGSAEKGLDLILQSPVDVAIVDLRLPGMDGEQFVLKAHKQFPGMRFLIHTGSVDFTLSRELIATGMTDEDLLRKPLPSMIVAVKSVQRLLNSD